VERDVARANGLTVGRTIGVPKDEPRRDASLDDQLSAMQRAMMGAAEDGQRIRIVTAAFRAKQDVVNIHEYALRTSRNDTPSSVAS
jgi:hypothetical protein